MTRIPANPGIFHIVHADRLPSIVRANGLLSDSRMDGTEGTGTTIGMPNIKRRRSRSFLASHPGLRVGDCVPFYFCPRSVMLYVIHKANHSELTYRGGQEDIVHLVADLNEAVAWAEQERKRWAFTLSNAGSRYFEDRCELGKLGEVDWNAVRATDWREHKEGKQAEFLVEERFPWNLIRRIGVHSAGVYSSVTGALQSCAHVPSVSVMPSWYY